MGCPSRKIRIESMIEMNRRLLFVCELSLWFQSQWGGGQGSRRLTRLKVSRHRVLHGVQTLFEGLNCG
jgi:hypothetical protein